MQSMKFDLNFEGKLKCSTHRFSQRYELKKKCCIEGHGSTGMKGSKGDWCQMQKSSNGYCRKMLFEIQIKGSLQLFIGVNFECLCVVSFLV